MPLSNPQYQKSLVETLAEQYGQGQVSAQEVTAALQPTDHQDAESLDEMLQRDADGEDGYSDDPNGWSAVENVYFRGGLSQDQFQELHQAAFH